MSTPTFRLTVAYNDHGPLYAKLSANVADLDAARELAATFAKSVKAQALSVSSVEGDYATVEVMAKLASSKAVGEVNEAGIKRVQSALRTIERNGWEVEYASPFKNSYATLDEARAATGI